MPWCGSRYLPTPAAYSLLPRGKRRGAVCGRGSAPAVLADTFHLQSLFFFRCLIFIQLNLHRLYVSAAAAENRLFVHANKHQTPTATYA